jgi:uncharacterized protein with beta-barrel porin domain
VATLPHFGALWILVIGLTVAGGAWGQGKLETLWNCKDKNGRTILTNQKADTAGKECRIVSEERVTVAPVRSASGVTTNATSKSPASFPKEDRAAAKSTQKSTLERELTQEEAMLGDAKRKLAEQEAIRTGDEKNYSKVIERLKPYQDTVEVHQKNVEALKRELNNLGR